MNYIHSLGDNVQMKSFSINRFLILSVTKGEPT